MLGENVYLNDGFFLDPSHCHLIRIEDGVTFGPSVRVFAHDASTKKIIGKTRIALVTIKKNVFIGAGSTILPGVTIGEGSVIGAGSVVSCSVPEGEIWAGCPARRIRSVDEQRHILAALPENDFSQSDYAIENLTAERRKEMIERLESVGLGFMK